MGGAVARGMTRGTYLLLLALGAAGCFGHEQRGDAAAARGDFSTAVEQYDLALEWGVDSPELRAKRYTALHWTVPPSDTESAQRTHDAAVATRAALLKCAEAHAWKCCFDYAVQLLELRDLMSEARTYTVLSARALGGPKTGELEAALSSAPGYARNLDETVAVFELVTAADARFAGTLAEVRTTRDRVRADEVSELALSALGRGGREDAREHCKAALALLPTHERCAAVTALLSGSTDRTSVEVATAAATSYVDSGAWPRALGLLELIAERDPSKRALLEQARREFNRVYRTRAANQWKRLCASCHGSDGDAQTRTGRTQRMRDMRNPAWQRAWTDARIEAVIRDGVPGTRMKGFRHRLDDEEVRQLSTYIRTLARPDWPLGSQ